MYLCDAQAESKILLLRSLPDRRQRQKQQSMPEHPKGVSTKQRVEYPEQIKGG
jgi:hypothetical protein